jgi:hypothetical protein
MNSTGFRPSWRIIADSVASPEDQYANEDILGGTMEMTYEGVISIIAQSSAVSFVEDIHLFMSG